MAELVIIQSHPFLEFNTMHRHTLHQSLSLFRRVFISLGHTETYVLKIAFQTKASGGNMLLVLNKKIKRYVKISGNG
jgi:hypothetical protein